MKEREAPYKSAPRAIDAMRLMPGARGGPFRFSGDSHKVDRGIK